MKKTLSAALLGVAALLVPGMAQAQYANIPVTTDYVVHPQGLCWMVDNATPYNLFVPMATADEFMSFANNAPVDVSAAQCCDAATVTVCSDTYSLPTSRTGTTSTLQYQARIAPGRSYTVDCQNIVTGDWQTLNGTGGANGVIYGVSVTQVGAWTVQYDIDTSSLPTYNIDYTCGGHNWSLTTPIASEMCNPSLPSSAFTQSKAINCFPDETHPSTQGPDHHVFDEQLCKTYAPMAGVPLGSGQFNNGWGRAVLNCGAPVEQ